MECMMHIIQKSQKFNIDAEGIGRLLLHITRLLDISADVKNTEGDTMLGSHGSSHGVRCHMMEAASDKCSNELGNLIKQLSSAGNKVSQIQRDDFQFMGFPIHCNKELVGMLCSCWRSETGKTVLNPEALLKEIANRISFEIQARFETDNLTQELSNRYEELHLIYEIGKKLGKVDSIENTIKLIAEHSLGALESDVLIVSLPGRNILEIICSSPSSLPLDIHNPSVTAKIHELITERLSHSAIYPVHIVSDASCNDEFQMQHDISLEILAAPIKGKSSMEGIMYLINFRKEHAFETGDMSLLTSLSEQISLLITNKDLYDNLKDFLLNVIKALVSAIEAKDSYTSGHSERGNTTAMMIADAMDLPVEEKKKLNWAAMLHDIGKIGVSGKILNKPGKLTREEFVHIRKHPETGYTILKPIHQLNESLEAILHHHEKYDGTGYPSGLRGSEIPVLARIIAVADTYDAMTSARSYRPEISHKDAIAEMERVKGKQLDPEIVDIFIKLI